MADSDDNYTSALLEEIRDEIRAVHEVVSGQPTREEFSKLANDVVGLKQDMKVVKAAVTDQGKQVQDHERQIRQLKTRAA